MCAKSLKSIINIGKNNSSLKQLGTTKCIVHPRERSHHTWGRYLQAKKRWKSNTTK
jgi:hypothetical protein